MRARSNSKVINPAIGRAALTVLVAAIAAGAYSSGMATTEQYMTFQGRLTDNSPEQNPINAPGGISMLVSIWDNQVGGNIVCGPESLNVPVHFGVFTVELGHHDPLGPECFTALPRYLEIAVQGEVLQPRQRITTVPWAFVSAKAQSAEDVECADQCVSPPEVDFNYADSDAKGGNARGLSCSGCVTPDMVSFNYANSTVKGGAATDLGCTNCVTVDEVVPDIVSSVEGVHNDGGNIDMVGGSGIVVSGSDPANTVTIRLGGPDWSWEETVNPGTSETWSFPDMGDHESYVVVMDGRKDTSEFYHQSNYGTNPVTGGWIGAEWSNLTDSSITVTRGSSDNSVTVGNQWDYIRVRIWKHQ